MSDPPIVLYASNSAHVATSRPIEVELADPTITLIIFSGIAVPTLYVNDDDKTYDHEVLVKLGINARHIDKAVTQVGLAAISNDETQFVFATNTGRLEIDPTTSELQLRVHTALRGEETYLHRFSYQIVAHVVKVASRISGTIRVPRVILDLSNKSRAELEVMFRATANRVEIVPSTPGETPPFSAEQLIPVANGRVEGVSCPGDDCFVGYVIDGCPFDTPLRVTVETSSTLKNLAALQVAGPRPVTLSTLTPTVAGVDFAIVVLPVP